MKEQELITMGFKKKVFDGEYWYELKCGDHLFITNDTVYNKRNDDWFIGYFNKKIMPDNFWFNEGLIERAAFKIIFQVLTGMDFKLAHQRKKVK